LIKERPKRLVVGQLGELFALDALRISQSFGLVDSIWTGIENVEATTEWLECVQASGTEN
jgi:hypothetical protein